MFRGSEEYLDSLYSNHHLQLSTEELLLPLNPQSLAPAYPTALFQPSGLVTHIDSSQEQAQFPSEVKPFDPAYFMSGIVHRRIVAPQSEQKPRARSAPSQPRVLSELAPPGAQLYEATYSGVDVYELLIQGNSLMRRRDDSWVNATHILKAANIEKGKRTKILEKEVHGGMQHEKVQGGYGKYQGTWVPLQTAKDLAHQFNVYDLVAPLLDIP